MCRQKITQSKTHKNRAITQTVDALCYAQKFKLKCAGHVTRLQDQRWTKKVTSWNVPIGKRCCRGRPNTRWEDDRKITGPLWQKVAKEQDILWLSLEEALTLDKGVLAKN